MINKTFHKRVRLCTALVLVITVTIMLFGCSADNSINKVNSMDEAASDTAFKEQPTEDKTMEPKSPNQNKSDAKPDVERQLKKSIKNTSVTGAVYGKPSSSKLKKVAYLTFDDGPSRNNTPKNLDILKQYDIKATFFVLPYKNVDDIYQRILQEGHEIGNHSYSHDYRILYGMEEDNFKLDLKAAQSFIEEKVNYKPILYRFPGGTMGKSSKLLKSRINILKEEGLEYIDWDVSDGDADMSEMGKKVDVLVNNVLDRTAWRDSAVILMHDSEDKTATVKALPAIIKGLKRQGFEFELLTEKSN